MLHTAYGRSSKERLQATRADMEMAKNMYNRSLLAAVPAPIWLDIFATVQTLTGGLRTPAQYTQYHMLRLGILSCHDTFLLRPDYPSSCLPSLLGHLHRCGRSTFTMDVMCTDADVLSCVFQQWLQLEAVDLQVVSQATVALLSGLYSLQRCELDHPEQAAAVNVEMHNAEAAGDEQKSGAAEAAPKSENPKQLSSSSNVAVATDAEAVGGSDDKGQVKKESDKQEDHRKEGQEKEKYLDA